MTVAAPLSEFTNDQIDERQRVALLLKAQARIAEGEAILRDDLPFFADARFLVRERLLYWRACYQALDCHQHEPENTEAHCFYPLTDS